MAKIKSEEWRNKVSAGVRLGWAQGVRKGHPMTEVGKAKLSAIFKTKRLAKFCVGKLIPGQRAKAWLLREGLRTDVCEVCGLPPKWNNKPITLELDHINGDRMDNRLENLRIICPNCHSQTDTYKWKNSKTVKDYSVSIVTRAHNSVAE